MLGRVSLGALVVGLAWFVLGCSGGAVPDAGPAAEARVVVSRVGSDGLSVGVEVRGSESESYERVLPEKHELTADQANEDWWESSEIAVEALGVVRIGAGSEGFGVDGASSHTFQDECGVLLIKQWHHVGSAVCSRRNRVESVLRYASRLRVEPGLDRD